MVAQIAQQKGLISFLASMANTFGQLDEVQIEIETGLASDLKSNSVSKVYVVVAGYKTHTYIEDGKVIRTYKPATNVSDSTKLIPATGY
ncbi:hypothetical protein JCM19233_108 [Vibrio astriarenae]|nr:hypothetical protein JCM19233_108 [Vibrio sp. C7]